MTAWQLAGGGEDLPCRNEGLYGVSEDVEVI